MAIVNHLLSNCKPGYTAYTRAAQSIGHPASEPYFKRVRNELGAIAMELLAANMEAARSDAASRGPAPLLSFDGRYHVRTNNQSPHATVTCVNLASNCLVAAVRSAPRATCMSRIASTPVA